MNRTILDDNNEEQVINVAIQTLNRGGLIIFPSDTVYGVLVDSTNQKAVEKLLRFKNRPKGKPISVFVSGFSMMEEYVEITSEQRKRLESVLPGSYTIVLPSKHKTSRLLEAENGSLGVRYVQYEPATTLVKCFGRPITATSANTSGQNPNYSIDSLLKQLNKNQLNCIDLIVDAGKLPYNQPSTVIDYSGDHFSVLREGSGSVNEALKQKKDELKNTIINKSKKKVKNITLITNSAQETFEFGKTLGADIQTGKMGNILLLHGDLGAGKTQLVKGIAAVFGIDDITSPTFNIYHEYDLSSRHLERSEAESRDLIKKEKDPSTLVGMTKNKFKKFIHADLYNIQDESEFDHLYLENYWNDENVVCIEWGEKMQNAKFNMQDVVEVNIQPKTKNKRLILLKIISR